MSLPDSFLSELKARANIEDIISAYLPLKRAGSNLVGNCPFHSEKTPSFTVFLNAENFYCFGCGAGGDVITFLMRMENLDYPSAVERLAARAGLPMPDGEIAEQAANKKRYLALNKAAARFFYDSLMDPNNREALSYLTDRGLTLQTVRRYGIGYADSEWNSLTGYLMGQGYQEQELRTAFLAGKSAKSGRSFDYFRGRIMFPIFDISGNVIAFGGRIIGQGEPKYLNTSDTPVFKKSRTLYALNYAKNHTDGALILCEGYMDVIALGQAGFNNAVATLGTAMTQEHARLMARHAKKVYLCYDSDDAGRAAAGKAISRLSEVGTEVRVITLPGAKDPDEYIKKFGKESFRNVLEDASGQVEYAFDGILKKYNLQIDSDKLKFIDELTGMLAALDSPVEREIHVQRAVSLTKISADSILALTEKKKNQKTRTTAREKLKSQIDQTIGYGDRINADKARFLSSSTKEENIIGLLLLHPEYFNEDQAKTMLSGELFLCDFNRRVFEKMEETGGEIARLSEFFSPEEMGRITRMSVRRGMLSNNSVTVLYELCEALKRENERAKSMQSENEDMQAYLMRIEELRKLKGKD